MKAILYVGAILMAAAGIYGFVDYKKTNKKLSGFYNKEQVRVSNTSTNIQKESKETVSAVSSKPEVAVLKTDNDKKMDPEAFEKTSDEKKAKKKTPVTQKKRKLNHKMYSRGALDERFIEKEIIPEEPKKDTLISTVKNR